MGDLTPYIFLVIIVIIVYFVLNQLGYRIYNFLVKNKKIKDSERAAAIWWVCRIVIGIAIFILILTILDKLNFNF